MSLHKLPSAVIMTAFPAGHPSQAGAAIGSTATCCPQQNQEDGRFYSAASFIRNQGDVSSGTMHLVFLPPPWERGLSHSPEKSQGEKVKPPLPCSKMQHLQSVTIFI